MKVTIDQAIEIIKKGGIVAMPTETVYGLAADATNLNSIKKTFEVKGRPQDNPLIVHISSVNHLTLFAENIPEDAYKLAEHFWPGPLTLVLDKKSTVLDAVTAGLDTVALRMPDHSTALELISKTGPVTAPSANLSGKPSPTKPEHIIDDYGDEIAYLDGGSTRIGIESTVLDMTSKPYTILRPGFVTKGELAKLLNDEVELSSDSENLKKSPGTRYSHYKPVAEVKWLMKDKGVDRNREHLFILHSKQYSNKGADNIYHAKENYNELARHLYDLFRTADQKNYKTIYIEPFSSLKDNSVIEAIVNRISKAVG